MQDYIYETDGRKRKANLVTCCNCLKDFLKPERFIKEDNNDFCSKECSYEFSKNRLIVPCNFCGIKFEKKLSNITKTNYCSRICKDNSQIKEEPTIYTYRKKAINKYGAICNRCNFSNIIALEVHHKDRDRNNNDIDNLEVLCSNCHKIEHGV